MIVVSSSEHTMMNIVLYIMRTFEELYLFVRMCMYLDLIMQLV